MNPYLNYQIARERQNEFIRQAQENQKFNRRMRSGSRQVARRLLNLFPTFPKSGLQISWLGTVVEKVGFGLANLGKKSKNLEPN